MIHLDKIDLNKFDPIDFRSAYIKIASTARRYMFYPGKIENINYFINASGAGITDLGKFNKLKKIGKLTELLFGCFVEKFYVLNAGWLFSALLNIVKGNLFF